MPIIYHQWYCRQYCNIYKSMIKVNNIAESDIYPRFQHVFSSKKYNIFKSYHLTTFESYLTKVIQIQIHEQNILSCFKLHIRNNVIPYLIKKMGINKVSSFLRILPDSSQILLKKKQQNQKAKQKNQSDDFLFSKNKHIDSADQQNSTNQIFYIQKKFIQGASLRQLILQKDKRLTHQNSYLLMKNIVDMIFRFGGINNFFISTQNIIIGNDFSINFNYFSFVGLQFFSNCNVFKADIVEMLPYLTEECFQDEQKQIQDKKDKKFIQNRIIFNLNLRFIVINFFSSFFRKDIVFDYIQIQSKDKKNSLKLLDQWRKIKKNRMAEKIFSEQDKKELQKFDQENNTNIKYLLDIVFSVQTENQQQKFILNWRTIFQKISKQTTYFNKIKHFMLKEQSKINLFERLRPIPQQPEPEYYNHFLVDFNKTVDHYIDILNHLFCSYDLVDKKVNKIRCHFYLALVKYHVIKCNNRTLQQYGEQINQNTEFINIETIQKIINQKKETQLQVSQNILNIIVNGAKQRLKNPGQMQVISKADLQHLASVLQSDQDYVINNKQLQNLFKTAIKLKKEREQYENRGWYIKQLFIPIKTGMTFTTILNYSNWFDMILFEKVADCATVEAVLNLLQFLLQMQQNMDMLLPYLTQSLVVKIIQKQNSNKTIKQQNMDNTYYYFDQFLKKQCFKQLLKQEQKQIKIKNDQNLGDLHSDDQSQKSSIQQQHQKNIDECNWQKKMQIYGNFIKSHISHMKVYIKQYYLRVTEKIQNNQVKVNIGKKEQLISLIETINYFDIKQDHHDEDHHNTTGTLRINYKDEANTNKQSLS